MYQNHAIYEMERPSRSNSVLSNIKHTVLPPDITSPRTSPRSASFSEDATSCRRTSDSRSYSPNDLMGHLQRSGPSVVKTRAGSVLSRGFILKTDYYPSGRALDLDLNVHGAPNFRTPRQANLNIFGVAQPRTQGLRAILSVLRCRPGTRDPSRVVWFSTREEPIVYISGRPFVLRDASEPRRTLALSDRAENLEAIELRLKNDILHESTRFGGLILTHNEMATDSGEGAILPTWTAVDIENVKTSRELWESMKEQGWNVDYYRIPISPDRPIEDNYLDAYSHVIKATDPLRTALVFSCGMGAVRTTFAMVAASLIRRKQLLDMGMPDPYAVKSLGLPPSAYRTGFTSSASPDMNLHFVKSETRMLQTLEHASAQQDLSKSLLRLTHLLQQCLHNGQSQSAIELLLSQPILLDNLRKAHNGSYGVILSLLGCLDNGLQSKKLVDRVVDACDHVTNLREDILIYRLKYSLTTMDETKGVLFLSKAVKALEKYFFMIAFASYVESGVDFSQTFSSWLKTRSEIWNQVLFLRKSYGSRLKVFAPINDLSALSKTGSDRRSLVPGKQNDVAIAGGQILGDEYSSHVVKNRGGIILREGTFLKLDQWQSQSLHLNHGVRGAINFRNIPRTNIYALGQPTIEAIDEVVDRIKAAHPDTQRIVWITLREEPIVYVNGAPYCLRRENFSLRNMKDYGGISASRLEVLEERLREDVVSELNAFGGQMLLHTENADGCIVPIWEYVRSEDVVALKDVMSHRRVVDGVELCYKRVPITPEQAPDFADLSELIDAVMRSESSNTPIVVNGQLGCGRSTMASVIVLLIQQWLERHRPHRALPTTVPPVTAATNSHRHSYQTINNLLRVIHNGHSVKSAVDEAIDQCAVISNLRDSIEHARCRAEEATDEMQQRLHAQKGLKRLRWYFELIVFQSYLQSIKPDTIQSSESIETYVKNRPVIKTFVKELIADGADALKPLERSDVADGVAHPDEVKQVVTNRSGSILSASTILKSDFFLNLQKMTLPERIDGSPNFRQVPLTLRLTLSRSSSPIGGLEFNVEDTIDGRMVSGSGMPTVAGLRRTLSRVGAGPDGHNWVSWTSLREEPVVYVAGRPHVLRLIHRPLENVEATGVTTATVESMEESFKADVLRELRATGGRVLLHDELEDRAGGSFSVVPLWETISEEDVQTPRDVFDLMVQEGYKIDYGRIAITDEQAPLPEALWQLIERIRAGLLRSADFVFNCQMGRGRTTTGMVTACLVSTTQHWHGREEIGARREDEDAEADAYDAMDGPSEEEAHRQGEYKTILQLVGVLSHGRAAKRLTDRAIDLMQDVQNLRWAIYDYKLQAQASEKGSSRERKVRSTAVKYLYRYGTLIVLANYLIEMREGQTPQETFPEWLQKHREITKLLERTSLD